LSLSSDHPKGDSIFTGFDQPPGQKLRGAMQSTKFLPKGHRGLASERKGV
jgi:hypothetical protein